jgi:hypothetical protein
MGSQDWNELDRVGRLDYITGLIPLVVLTVDDYLIVLRK